VLSFGQAAFADPLPRLMVDLVSGTDGFKRHPGNTHMVHVADFLSPLTITHSVMRLGSTMPALDLLVSSRYRV
jgi:hypothetical protein